QQPASPLFPYTTLFRSQPSRADTAGEGFFIAEVTQPHQQVVGLVEVARETLRKQPLQLELDSGDRVWIKQLAQVFAAEQLGQQIAVEGQRLGAAFGEGLVALIHELGHVREEKRRGKRRCL